MTSTMKSVFHSVVFNASWKLNAFPQSSLSLLCQFHEHLRQIRDTHRETKSNNTQNVMEKSTRYKNENGYTTLRVVSVVNLIRFSHRRLTQIPNEGRQRESSRYGEHQPRNIVVMNYNHKFALTMRIAPKIAIPIFFTLVVFFHFYSHFFHALRR